MLKTIYAGVTFGEALGNLKLNNCVITRDVPGYDGMYLSISKGSHYPKTDPVSDLVGGVPAYLFELGPEGTVTRFPTIDLKGPDGATVTGFSPSTADLLAEDWVIMEIVSDEADTEASGVAHG
jgi:hypothetical protein